MQWLKNECHQQAQQIQFLQAAMLGNDAIPRLSARMDTFAAALDDQLKISEMEASKIVSLSELKALIDGAVAKAKLETVQNCGAAGKQI